MNKIVNPFIVYGYVSPEYFCDRKEETSKLISALRNGRNVTLMSPRRMGKTGLIHNAFQQINRNMRTTITTLLLAFALTISAQTAKIYDETINPLEQIDSAVAKAKEEGKFVVAQVGGNWCKWCLMFAKFITEDTEIKKVVDDNFVYIHVNYPRKDAATELMKRLDNAGRFGYPAIVVLRQDGSVMHIQDSSFLEEGNGYNKEKVMRFFQCWTPEAVGEIK